MLVALVEQDEMAKWNLVIVEDDGEFTPVLSAYSPDPIIRWANTHDIEVVTTISKCVRTREDDYFGI